MSLRALLRHPRRTTAAVALTALATAVGSSLVVSPAATAAARTDAGAAPVSRLGPHDDRLLAEARAAGKRTVTLLVAAKGGAARDAVRQLEGIGGVVRKQDADLDYLRVDIPVTSAERAAGLPAVDAVDLDQVLRIDPPAPEAATAPPSPQPAPGPSTARDNPWLPVGETGAADFTAANPTYDGRGTTIGILDTGVDLAHPALQRTTTGQAKVVDWVTATDPGFDAHGDNVDGDPTWVHMVQQVSGPVFTAAGRTWTAPAGRYRFGTVDERDERLGGEVGNDLDRDGRRDEVYGLLWDTRADTVRVDRDSDGDFVEEPALGGFTRTRQSSVLGADDPETPVVEAMRFVVQTDGRAKAVNLGIVSGAHGTHVAGIAAANGLFGGAMSGAAPGAQLVSVRVCTVVGGCTAHALVEGMAYAARTADVINLSIGGLPALNDGNDARALLYDRIVERKKVAVFVSAGNSGPGMNTVGDPSVASRVLSVGSSISAATWRSNYGVVVSEDMGLHGFSSRGPREDGGFKPEIVAPGAAVSSIPTWQAGSGASGTAPLPPGHAMFHGTSMAAPQAAGVGALLVSAAEQAGVKAQPAQLRQALMSSATQIDGYGSYEQGTGLIDAGAAWEVLRRTVTPVQITASVPVRSALSDWLVTPGAGTGIHDREGVVAGTTYTRTYTFTRTSGGGGTRTYSTRFVGDDGTFSAAPEVALPLGTPVSFPVTITAGVGAHSAVLELDDPATPGIDLQTLNTVVAADTFTAANGSSVTRSGSVGRGRTASHFFAVAPGTPALTVDLQTGTDAGSAEQVRFLRFHPYGTGIESNSASNCYGPSVGGCDTGSPTSRTVSEPQAGVWEVSVEAHRTSTADSIPYRLTATVLGATVSPALTVATAQAGTPVAGTVTVENDLGAFTGRATGTALGSALRATSRIADGEVQTRDVLVTSGATSLRATIGRTGDPATDLDLSVYDCTGATGCALVGRSADDDSEESVTVDDPAAGTYRVVVEGYAVPAGSTTYSYVDVFTAPAFGAVTTSDTDEPRPAGRSWPTRATVSAHDAPSAGRVLLGAVEVRTDGGVLVGSGDVVVERVTR